MGTKDRKIGRERRAESRAKDFAPSVESTSTGSQAQHCLISLHTSIAAVRSKLRARIRNQEIQTLSDSKNFESKRI